MSSTKKKTAPKTYEFQVEAYMTLEVNVEATSPDAAIDLIRNARWSINDPDGTNSGVVNIAHHLDIEVWSDEYDDDNEEDE
jgi:hypothetical protein